jgi:hypothetical protein
MGYADNVQSATRPSCWGNARSYDQNDVECSDCRYRHSCSVEVNRGGGVRINPSYRTSYQPRNTTANRDGGEEGVNQPAVIGPEEKPVERFAKDAVGGGLRGMFYEMWQFWRHYRIR